MSKVNAENLAEYQAFIQAKKALDEYLDAFKDVFVQMEPYIDRYNKTMAAAKKAVSATGEETEFFKIHQRRTKYDADALFEAVGREKFISWGGALVTREEAVIADKDKLLRAISRDELPQGLAELVVQKTVAYKSTEPVTIPTPWKK